VNRRMFLKAAVAVMASLAALPLALGREAIPAQDAEFVEIAGWIVSPEDKLRIKENEVLMAELEPPAADEPGFLDRLKDVVRAVLNLFT
jgi:hypothetical protein